MLKTILNIKQKLRKIFLSEGFPESVFLQNSDQIGSKFLEDQNN